MEQIRKCLSLLDAEGRRKLRRLGVQIFFSSILEMMTVSMILPFLALLGNPRMADSATVKAVISFGGFRHVQQFLIAMGGFLLVLVVGKNIYLYFATRAQSRFCQEQAARVSIRIFSRYLHAPYKAHLARNSASLINIADHATEQAFSLVMMPFLICVTEASAMTAILLLLLFVEPLLTASLGILVIGSATVIILLLRGQLSTMGLQASMFRILRLKVLQQSLHSVKEIKIFGREDFFLSHYADVRRKNATVQSRAESLAQTPRQILEIVIIGGLLLVVLLVLLQGRVTGEIVATLGLFAMAAFRIMPGANRLVSGYNTIKHGSAYLNNTVDDYFGSDLTPEYEVDPKFSPALREALTFQGITFQYEGANVPSLRDISATIRPGETIGLVGSSGAGKSTLVDVMLGLLRPQSGHVLLDGQDVTGQPYAWAQVAGYVPQSVSLIDDTLRNNVAFGIYPAQINDETVWDALRRANLEEFCRALPAGLDTEIGERGVRMSGGQRQRIGIARALYCDPEILVLDEATSALDNESEREITKAIEDLRDRKTIIIIAHRLSTVRKCHRLFLMKKGQIVASGSFDSLVDTSDDFARMVKLAELASGSGADLSLQ